MPGRGVPVDVVTDGVAAMVDVPCGLPVVCGVGMDCGLTAAQPLPHTAASNMHRDARIASGAMCSNPSVRREPCTLEA
jgi:hypothetical protein